MVLIRLTNLEMNEIKKIMQGDIRDAKKVMAYEVTKTIHGEEKAKEAFDLATNMFANNNFDNAPECKVQENISILDALTITGLCSSKGEARRMIEQGGISLNDCKITTISYTLTNSDFSKGYAILKKGKKQFIKIVK